MVTKRKKGGKTRRNNLSASSTCREKGGVKKEKKGRRQDKHGPLKKKEKRSANPPETKGPHGSGTQEIQPVTPPLNQRKGKRKPKRKKKAKGSRPTGYQIYTFQERDMQEGGKKERKKECSETTLSPAYSKGRWKKKTTKQGSLQVKANHQGGTRKKAE